MYKNCVLEDDTLPQWNMLDIWINAFPVTGRNVTRGAADVGLWSTLH